jgi:UDP-N-acetylglucosamine 2-epimerase (non-hydrolysing)
MLLAGTHHGATENQVSILAVVGTRPEVIKLAPVVHALRRQRIAVEVVATGQHHDVRMMGTFLETFGLEVDHTLTLHRRDLYGSMLDILDGLGPIFKKVRPQLALAQGDTTTVFATAIAARKLGCGFGHVEAGLRAFSRELPEEEHRICADALADLLFAPTRIGVENLNREHVNGRVIHTGNTILVALRSHPPTVRAPHERAGVLVTLHRQETVDDPVRLGAALAALRTLGERERVEWPMHPRTFNKLVELGLPPPPNVAITEPVGHIPFLDRLAGVRLVVTDSGGVQEEAAILGTPCVVVRENTERPETIDAGVSLLAGTTTEGILKAVDEILGDWPRYGRPVPHLYGEGRAAEHIAEACQLFLGGEVGIRARASAG